MALGSSVVGFFLDPVWNWCPVQSQLVKLKVAQLFIVCVGVRLNSFQLHLPVVRLKLHPQKGKVIALELTVGHRGAFPVLVVEITL